MSNIEDILKGIQTALSKIEQTAEQFPAPIVTKVHTEGLGSLNRSLEEYTQEYIDFTYTSPTIYHVIDYFSKKLNTAGFKYVSEKEDWSELKPGKYYTIRNGTNLVAFSVGKDWTADKGAGVIGSHVDALTNLLKPSSVKNDVDGYELLGIAPYGGTLSNTLWWDRDLGIGGRLLIKDPESKKVTQKLVDSTPNPIAHIPTLAPHFGVPAVGPFNKETQAVPVIGFSTSSEEELNATDDEKSAPLYGRHSLKLLRYVAKLAKVNVSDILQWDLQLYDIQKGTVGGLDKEFLFAPRLDDRICSYAAINALIEADHDSLLASNSFSIVDLVDHEEVGSLSRTGAKGGLLELVVSRVLSTDHFQSEVDVQEQIRLAYANTIILSADVIHLLNPNFAGVYLEHHKPLPNTGITVSLDSSGSMATDNIGVALVGELAKLNNDTLQYFQIRNDSRSGGTIGPAISSQTGARTIDLGIPQLSMHSIRATTGSKDVGLGSKFFKGFFANWRDTYDKFIDL